MVLIEGLLEGVIRGGGNEREVGGEDNPSILCMKISLIVKNEGEEGERGVKSYTDGVNFQVYYMNVWKYHSEAPLFH
jgi:hypothetical protein